MPESACGQCDYFEECPVQKGRDGYQVDHTAPQRRTAGRRREEATDVFRQRYRVRSGIEGTNSGLKRRTGLGQLRVRGRPAVFRSILLKVTGWNILRASACAKMREIIYERAHRAAFYLYFVAPSVNTAHDDDRDSPRRVLLAFPCRFTDLHRSSLAA